MATLKQMLDICGNIDNAKKFAKKLIYENNLKDAWMDLSLLNAVEGNYTESIKCLENIKNYSPYKYHYFYCMGYYKLLLEHNLFEAFQYMNLGRFANLWGNSPLQTNKPLFTYSISDIKNINEFKNKSILVNMEAGIGDQIVFIRFVKELKNKFQFNKIYILCHESLIDIFNNFEFIDNAYDYAIDLNKIDFDFWVPSMYLPVTLETQFNDLSGKPYLYSDNTYVKKYSNIIKNNKNKKKIGIRWLGKIHDDYITRVFPKELMFDIFKDDEIRKKFDIYSLQINDNNSPDFNIPDNITNLEKYLKSWNDTIGIIENLDLIITSCTSIAHISAALGKETWVIIPKTPYYVWISEKGFSEKTPWYDSVILYRQNKYNEWNDIFEKIKNDLKKYIL